MSVYGKIRLNNKERNEYEWDIEDLDRSREDSKEWPPGLYKCDIIKKQSLRSCLCDLLYYLCNIIM